MDKLITNLDTNLGPVLREQLDSNFQKIQNGVDGQADVLNKQIATMLGTVPLQDKNEVTQARIDNNGVPYQTLKGRIDVNQVTAETALKEERLTGAEVQSARSNTSGKTYPSLADRINDEEATLINGMNAKISQISSVPETLASLSALQSTYPNGKTGLFVTADNGHKYIYVNGLWTDAGVYQSVGISDGSIDPQKLVTSYVPVNKTGKIFDQTSPSTTLFILNQVLDRGGIINIGGNFGSSVVTVFLLKKINDAYVVIDKIKKTAGNGFQTIVTDFFAEGTGDEYIGVMGFIKYSKTGGTGFYGINLANENDKIFRNATFTADYDLSVFPTFETLKLAQKVETIDNEINGKGTINTTDGGEKDFATYDVASVAKKNYINNSSLHDGNIIVHVNITAAQTGKLYILEKNGLTFTVKKYKDVNFVAGENIVDMEYTASGNGNEYIGYFGIGYFKRTGGFGFYESIPGDYLQGDTFTATDNTAGTVGVYDLSVYAEYSRVSVKTSIKVLSEKIDENTSLNTSIKLTDYSMPKYSEISDPVGFVGRWFDKEVNGISTKTTINQGSEFYFKVKNTTTININFVLNTTLKTPVFAYSIDGSPMTRQLTTSPLLPAVTTDEHIIRIVVEALDEHEDKWNGEKGVSFKDVTVDAGGVVTGVLPKNRKIMFFGDSITEGIRVLNMNADPDGNSATGAYPFITSKT